MLLVRVRCLAFLLFVAGCGGATGSTVDAAGDTLVAEGPRADRPAADALPPPRVTSVTDTGKDGDAVVGEVVLLEGESFGPGCKVRFGTVEARVISHAQVELRFQVPEGIPVGAHQPTLACGNGSTSFKLGVRRYHLVTLPPADRIAVLGETAVGQIQDTKRRLVLADADRVALSNDSAVAYVGSSTSAAKAPTVGIVGIP